MDLSVKQKFNAYPEEVALVLEKLRSLIFSVAREDGIDDLTETLKWGEPSYVSKIGSTVRFDWKAKHPQQYCVYFNCRTSLIDTFQVLYGDTFNYQGNRAIVLSVNQQIPKELAHCISLSLRYKKIKHLALLGCIQES